LITVSIAASVLDLAGNAFAAQSASFTTATAGDTTAPVLREAFPAVGSVIEWPSFSFRMANGAAVSYESIKGLDETSVLATNETTGIPVRGMWVESHLGDDYFSTSSQGNGFSTTLSVLSATDGGGTTDVIYTTDLAHDLLDGDNVF